MDSNLNKATVNDLNKTAEENMHNQWCEEQNRLAAQLIEADEFEWSLDPTQQNCLRYIGGVDISFVKENCEDACACLVVLTYPDLKVIYEKCHLVKMTLPYISGFLAFREVPFLLQLLHEVKETHQDWMPQVILVDGNGKLHHRGFGIACHFGVLTGLPTVGVSKTLLSVDGLSISTVRETFKRTCTQGGQYIKLFGNSGVLYGVVGPQTTS
jgi:deoxyinosine 3'endonuclease (endonuclease V)